MIPMHDQPCPIDGSELLFLGGSFAWEGQFDVAYYYCPRCDAGFVAWANPGYEKPVVFTWRRRGTDLILDPSDAPKVSDYVGHGWEVAQSTLLHGVRLFLQSRFSKVQGCPNDGGKIPLVAEMPYQESTIRFYWCSYCGELFAYLRDDDYGWRCVASFAYDKDGYHLRSLPRNAADRELIQERVSTLPPPTVFRR